MLAHWLSGFVLCGDEIFCSYMLHFHPLSPCVSLTVLYIYPGECAVLYQKAGEERWPWCIVGDVEWKFNNILIIYINDKTGSKWRGISFICFSLNTIWGKNDYHCSQTVYLLIVNTVDVFLQVPYIHKICLNIMQLQTLWG